MTCGYQAWHKDGSWLGVTFLTTKSHILLTMRLREVTWQMNFIIYLFLRSLLPLNLTGWWLMKLKSRRQFNKYMVGFSFSYQILTQLKKFLWWSYFIPKALSFFHQFHQFPEKYLCGSSCVKIRVLNQEKIPDQHF